MALLSIFLLLAALVITTVQGNLSPLRWPGRGDGGDATYITVKYGNSKYLISRKAEPFDLAKMNGRCRGSGGYLLQIDNRTEDSYVRYKLKKIRDRSLVYTGITDLGSEGRFYNYNDKTPAGYLKWRRRQPDNWRGKEHCVNISRWGLNDIDCGRTARYICEIPL
ncbi:C-type lectin [Plakobranchus ocellatus]|uniref:C-type lectin n=1 Tax=Plakobranchus ocellatus TaxID=259542 RepID=A0AAV4CGP4_9GAST|nr:C-type lectin [Plakobranchus ocellatus]